MGAEELGGQRVDHCLKVIAAEISGQLVTLDAQEQAALCFCMRALIEGISEGFGAAPLSGNDQAREIARYAEMMRVA